MTTVLGVDTIKKCDDPRTAGPSRSACGEGGEDGAEVPLQHYKLEGPSTEAMKHPKGLDPLNRVCREITAEEEEGGQ